MFLFGIMFTVSGLKPLNQNYNHQEIQNPNTLYNSLAPSPVYYGGLAGSSLFLGELNYLFYVTGFVYSLHFGRFHVSS